MSDRSSPGRTKRRIRCAIYTRKSSEEGLEQQFNSLDAQREACEAFILSQKHEGWSVLPQAYDDGGVSGGTMDRPALKRLLADIAAGRIDCVVVYKVDRLTRALSDFARMVEVFDRENVSFVSVTQQFNTTTSMGRLTLNVLLSFAQFEREVTGERIRDKISASKKKGMWMGGLPPLGYDVQDRKLIVNEAEAERVRTIFRRYAQLKSVRLLQNELEADGIVSKARRAPDGARYGAKPFSRGALYLMLSNRIYRGEIVHKGQSYPGEHQAIIDDALWEEMQAILASNRVERESGANHDEPSLLAGLIHDETGERMTPTHASKKGKRYRYYVSRPLITGEGKGGSRGRRIPARSIEQLVSDRVRSWLADPSAILDVVAGQGLDAPEQVRIAERAKQAAEILDGKGHQERRDLLHAILSRVEVQAGQVILQIDPARLLGTKVAGEAERDHLVILSIPARLVAAGAKLPRSAV
jgi:site-specific DNA recombinase